MKRRKESQLAQKLDSKVVEALRKPAAEITSFKEWLLAMPDVGTNRNLERNRRPPRPVRL